jgi:hypothetical protein
MSKKIIIYDGVESNQALAAQLRQVADLIEDGFESGYAPAWEIVEDEDDDE